MEKELNQLIRYAITNKLIDESKVKHSIAKLSKLLHIDIFKFEDIVIKEDIEVILNRLIDEAISNDLIHGTSIDDRDAFEAALFDCVMPSPLEVKERFKELYIESSSKATYYLYKLSKDVNYIKSKRLEKNMHWFYQGLYGKLELTINLSKPEKDPKDIALSIGKIDHPKDGAPICVICKENEQNYLNARMNLRIVPIVLGNELWHFQYSPYLYYDEHSIILHDQHRPMKINHQTFEYLLDFIDMFPTYFIGSNADLPIVGGSILNHDHFQGGKYHFPIEYAKEIRDFGKVMDVHVSHLFWPLSTIRLKSDNRSAISKFSKEILNQWTTYENEELGIIPNTKGDSHQTITPILRKNEGLYEMDIILRNNRTSIEFPDGIFHPHPEVHHIKKENIGLIEAMGLAILPGRLKTELYLIEKYLKNEIEFSNEIEKHKEWIEELKARNITGLNQNYLLGEVAKKFEKVIEHSGVFKLDKKGLNGMHQFILNVIEGINNH